MRYEYDDPYNFLALHLISISTNAEIQRLLVDDDFIFRMVVKEVRGQDFIGPFLDCIITNLLEEKERMEFMHELDKLSAYFFKKLDIERLRDKITKYATTYHIIVI